MRKYWVMPIAAIAMAAATAASAGTYIPVPMVPGAVSEIAFSINNKNIVAGSYRDSANVEHGFFGPLDGSNWTTFDAPFEGTTGTEARSINDDGVIIGIATNPNFKIGEEFYRTPDGTFTVFMKDGVPLDGIAQGLNRKDASVGDYISLDGKTVGYLGQSGEYLKDFKLHLHSQNKSLLQVSPRGRTNSKLAVAGFFVDQRDISWGFIQIKRSTGGFVEVIGHENGVGVTLQDINNSLLASGQWIDANGGIHAFTVDENEHYTDLEVDDGSTSQWGWGLNDHGFVAISTNTGRSYIYCPKTDAQKCSVEALAKADAALSSRKAAFRP